MLPKIFLCSVFTLLISLFSFAQPKEFSYKNDLYVRQISQNCFIHVSVTNSPQFGRFWSNGVIFINNGKAALFDTPSDTILTKQLINMIEDSLKCKVVLFAPNHWHEDCIGGLSLINKMGVKSYSSRRTKEISLKHDLPTTSNVFGDSLEIKLDDKSIKLYYFGPAHTLDNIVVYIPSDNVLFPGCMIKETRSATLGNTVDGDKVEYPKTIKKVKDRFPSVNVVVPGHGTPRGVELIQHTYNLSIK